VSSDLTAARVREISDRRRSCQRVREYVDVNRRITTKLVCAVDERCTASCEITTT